MPVLDFLCKACSYRWEQNVDTVGKTVYSSREKTPTVVEEHDIECPECASTHVARDLSTRDSLTVQFKGMGWAIKEQALDAIGMPSYTRNSPEAQKKLGNL